MSTNDNTSTLKSYVDSATGYVQNVVGSVMGSSGDQVGISRNSLKRNEPPLLTIITGRRRGKAEQG
jgi:hypothetical protein